MRRAKRGKSRDRGRARTGFQLLEVWESSRQWSIGARGVWHVSRVSRGAPTNLACEGRVACACLGSLARGACQPRFVRRRGASYTHAALVAGARHVPVGGTVLVECVSPTKAGRTLWGEARALGGTHARRVHFFCAIFDLFSWELGVLAAMLSRNHALRHPFGAADRAMLHN